MSRRADAAGAGPRGRRGRRAGFTLVEMLVAAALGLLVLTAATAMFAGQLRAYLRVRGISAVQRDLRLGIALLPMDLRGASRRDGDLLVLTDDAIELRATVRDERHALTETWSYLWQPKR